LFRGFNLLPVFIGDTICYGESDLGKLAPFSRVVRVDENVHDCQLDQVGATLVGQASCLSFVARTCPCNALRALCHRHGVAAPPVVNSFAEAIGYFHSICGEIIELYVEQLAIWQDGWLAKWPASKRAQIIESQRFDEVTPDVVDILVKREGGHSRASEPRLIQHYVNLATQAAFGPVFYSLQKAYTAWFQRREVFLGIRVTFASGLNAAAIGAWMKDVLRDLRVPYFYERDGKRWDATMQKEHLAVRLAAYALAGAEFLAFVTAGFTVYGRDPRGMLRYFLNGTVKSGHNDTTLGNSIVNAMIAALVMRLLGLSGDIIVTGDDLLVAVEGDFDERAFANEEAKYGINPEYRKFSNPADVSFVSGVWFSQGASWVFSPKPGRLLARLFWTTHPPAPRDRASYLNGVVQGLRPACGKLPVIGAFLDAHYTIGVAAADYYGSASHDKWNASQRVTDDVLASFCDRYDLTPTDVDDVETLIRAHSLERGLISHPVIDRLMAVDLADLAARPLSRSSY